MDLSLSPKWELIIVNNNSDDLTEDVVYFFSDQLPIKYVFESKQGLSHARNAGLKAADGDLIIFTDDDIKPCKDWLNIYWNAYQKGGDKFFWGGPIESEFEKTPEDMELIFLAPCSVKGLNWGDEEKFLSKGEFFVSANWACSRNNLDKVGSFDVNLGLNPSSGKVLVGEETDLMNRLEAIGVKPYYLPNATIRHFVPKSKITIEHIADRTEATGKNMADTESTDSVNKLFGVPRWMWLRLVTLYGQYVLRKAKGGKAYREYLKYRRFKGEVMAFRAHCGS